MKKHTPIIILFCSIAFLVAFGAYQETNTATHSITEPQPTIPISLHPEEIAVEAAVESAQIGGIYEQLIGEPSEILTEYIPGETSYWRIALQGTIRVIIPAAPPNIPEKIETAHYLIAWFNDSTGEIERTEVYPTDVPPDLSKMTVYMHK